MLKAEQKTRPLSVMLTVTSDRYQSEKFLSTKALVTKTRKSPTLLLFIVLVPCLSAIKKALLHSSPDFYLQVTKKLTQAALSKKKNRLLHIN